MTHHERIKAELAKLPNATPSELISHFRALPRARHRLKFIAKLHEFIEMQTRPDHKPLLIYLDKMYIVTIFFSEAEVIRRGGEVLLKPSEKLG